RDEQRHRVGAQGGAGGGGDGAGDGHGRQVDAGGEQPDGGPRREGAADRREEGRREGLQDEQAAALGAGEAHGAQPGQQGGAFGRRAHQGEQQGEDGVSGARGHRGGVDAFGAGLEGGVDVGGAFVGADLDGGRVAHRPAQRGTVEVVAGHEERGGPGGAGAEPGPVHDQEVVAGDGRGPLPDLGDPQGDGG